MSILKVTSWFGAHAPLGDGTNDDGVYLSVLSDGHRLRGLDKVAGADRFTPVTQGFIEDKLPGMLRSGNVYVLDTALGAGEAWSSNINADWFGENMLIEKTPTFVSRAHPFFAHQNKDPLRAKGVILYAAYNQHMRRVELVVELARSTGGDVVAAIERGEYPRTSMGFRAEFDHCSICHNKAYSRSQYCEHLKLEPNKIYPDGRKVYAINTDGYFFDHSYVMVPADRTAGTMVILAKVASAGHTMLSADVAEEMHMSDPGPAQFSLFNKEAAEDVTDVSELLLKRVYPSIWKSWHPMPDALLFKLAEVPLQHTFATLASAGVILHPADFQFLALVRGGDAKLAKLASAAREKRVVFPLDAAITWGHWQLSEDSIEHGVAKLAGKWMRNGSFHAWNLPLWDRGNQYPLSFSRLDGKSEAKLASAYRSYLHGWRDCAPGLASAAAGMPRVAAEFVKSAVAPWIEPVAWSKGISGLASAFAAHHAIDPFGTNGTSLIEDDLRRRPGFVKSARVAAVAQAAGIAAGVFAKLATLQDKNETASFLASELDTIDGLALESILSR